MLPLWTCLESDAKLPAGIRGLFYTGTGYLDHDTSFCRLFVRHGCLVGQFCPTCTIKRSQVTEIQFGSRERVYKTLAAWMNDHELSKIYVRKILECFDPLFN